MANTNKADSTKYVEGSDLMIFVDGYSVAGSTTCSLEVSADLTTTTTKTKDERAGGFQTSKLSSISWTASSDNTLTFTGYGAGNETYATLFNKMVNGEEVEIVFAIANTSSITDYVAPTEGYQPTEATSSKPYVKGSALIQSLSLTAQDNEKATFSVSFQGNGALAYTEATTSTANEGE